MQTTHGDVRQVSGCELTRLSIRMNQKTSCLPQGISLQFGLFKPSYSSSALTESSERQYFVVICFLFWSLCLNSAGFLLSNHAACPQRGWAHTKTDAVTKTQHFPFIFNGIPCDTSLFNINRKIMSLFIKVLYWIRPHLPVGLPDLVTWAFGGKKYHLCHIVKVAGRVAGTHQISLTAVFDQQAGSPQDQAHVILWKPPSSW